MYWRNRQGHQEEITEDGEFKSREDSGTGGSGDRAAKARSCVAVVLTAAREREKRTLGV